MNIAIRADASTEIGSGHVMRCLTLAGELNNCGAGVIFVCRELPGNMTDYIHKKGYAVYKLPFEYQNEIKECSDPVNEYCGLTAANNTCSHLEKIEKDWNEDANLTLKALQSSHDEVFDWLIVDHYALDKKWESYIRPAVKNIMVIDDLANRPHDCELLLDQNLHDNKESRYEGLIPAHCKKLLGPGNALLRPDFKKARKKLHKREGLIKRVLVFFGGADLKNDTAKALDAIKLIEYPDIVVDVVVGMSNQKKEEIKNICEQLPNTNYYCQIDNMAELMKNADLAIGAGGSVTWERCCVGLPGVYISQIDHQDKILKAIHDLKAGLYLGDSNEVTSEDIYKAIMLFFRDYNIEQYSRNAYNLLTCCDTYAGNNEVCLSEVGFDIENIIVR